jgi:hypothetical protein
MLNLPHCPMLELRGTVRIRPHQDAEYMSANRILHQVDRSEASIYLPVFTKGRPSNIG